MFWLHDGIVIYGALKMLWFKNRVGQNPTTATIQLNTYIVYL